MAVSDTVSDVLMLKAGVKDWQIRYPQNPGQMLPTALVNMQNQA